MGSPQANVTHQGRGQRAHLLEPCHTHPLLETARGELWSPQEHGGGVHGAAAGVQSGENTASHWRFE